VKLWCSLFSLPSIFEYSDEMALNVYILRHFICFDFIVYIQEGIISWVILAGGNGSFVMFLEKVLAMLEALRMS